MAKSEELTAEFEYERNVFGVDDSRTIIGVLADKTVIKGRAREGELEAGLTYLFRGRWTTHPNYGRQFQFYSFGIAQPAGQRGTVAYLQRGSGIGRKRALVIWELYGADSLEVLRSHPEEVAAKVNGLTEQKAKEAAAYFQSHKDREVVTRDLEELLSGGGFPKKLIEKLIEKWGAKAAELVKANPFCLMIFSGVGYGKADKLYLSLGGEPTNPERLGWCAQHALASDREGNSWIRPSIAIKAMEKSVAGVTVDGAMGLKWGLDAKIIVQRIDERGNQWIAEAGRAAAEARLANQVHRAMVESLPAALPLPGAGEKTEVIA